MNDLNKAKEELKKVIDNFGLHYHEISSKFGLSPTDDKQSLIMLDKLSSEDKKEIPTLWRCNLDFKKLKQELILKDGYLSFLYEIPKEEQEYFLSILAHTSLAKIYFDRYCSQWRYLKEMKLHKQQESIFDKVAQIIDFNNLDNNSNQIQNTLYYLKQTSLNNHYTERQLFEDFLFRSNSFLKKHKEFSKKKIIGIVNKIIESYFDSNMKKFTIKFNLENLDSFICKTYNYETARGIDLIHTLPKRQKPFK